MQRLAGYGAALAGCKAEDGEAGGDGKAIGRKDSKKTGERAFFPIPETHFDRFDPALNLTGLRIMGLSV